MVPGTWQAAIHVARAPWSPPLIQPSTACAPLVKRHPYQFTKGYPRSTQRCLMVTTEYKLPPHPHCIYVHLPSGYHDASSVHARGAWFPEPHLIPRTPFTQNLVLWGYEWSDSIKCQLSTPLNPNGSITDSDLELAGGLLHLKALAQVFDVRERIILYWQRKASSTTDKVPAYLLCLFGIHQRYYRYMPWHDYMPGPSNPIADTLSRMFQLSDTEMLAHFQKHFNSLNGSRYGLHH